LIKKNKTFITLRNFAYLVILFIYTNELVARKNQDALRDFNGD